MSRLESSILLHINSVESPGVTKRNTYRMYHGYIPSLRIYPWNLFFHNPDWNVLEIIPDAVDPGPKRYVIPIFSQKPSINQSKEVSVIIMGDKELNELLS